VEVVESPETEQTSDSPAASSPASTSAPHPAVTSSPELSTPTPSNPAAGPPEPPVEAAEAPPSSGPKSRVPRARARAIPRPAPKESNPSAVPPERPSQQSLASHDSFNALEPTTDRLAAKRVDAPPAPASSPGGEKKERRPTKTELTPVFPSPVLPSTAVDLHRGDTPPLEERGTVKMSGQERDAALDAVAQPTLVSAQPPLPTASIPPRPSVPAPASVSDPDRTTAMPTADATGATTPFDSRHELTASLPMMELPRPAHRGDTPHPGAHRGDIPHPGVPSPMPPPPTPPPKNERPRRPERMRTTASALYEEDEDGPTMVAPIPASYGDIGPGDSGFLIPAPRASAPDLPRVPDDEATRLHPKRLSASIPPLGDTIPPILSMPPPSAPPLSRPSLPLPSTPPVGHARGDREAAVQAAIDAAAGLSYETRLSEERRSRTYDTAAASMLGMGMITATLASYLAAGNPAKASGYAGMVTLASIALFLMGMAPLQPKNETKFSFLALGAVMLAVSWIRLLWVALS
jgi:hypothetical protein